ncbi:hypothetical protein L195_g000755 [Trifolium pratense]|uniref:DUF668 domain-containing protein n=1 Tax=Trifolium pratense TaxID=57577 RepID=A0A2K3NMT1_TRIPR|nr:hypothetical protein L195_g000755 [Trifolium pratense]
MPSWGGSCLVPTIQTTKDEKSNCQTQSTTAKPTINLSIGLILHISMKGETVNVTWLSGFWPVPRKIGSEDKDRIGIMAFEVAGLMSKLVNFWHSLSDNEVMNLREWIVNSVGVKMLVSDDEYFLMELTWNEILHNFQSISQSVARLGWEYRLKKMEKKVKKMERFVTSMSLLSQELEVLKECEQTLRRMKLNRDMVDKAKLVEFQKKVMWQRQQVQNVRDLSPWSRSYDYIVRLLARSLCTILERIIFVFGNSHLPIENQQNDSSRTMNYTNNHLARNNSFPAALNVMQSSVHPSETNLNEFFSGPIGRKNKSKKKKKVQQVLQSQDSCEKLLSSEGKQLKYIGSFKGCISIQNDSDYHVVQSCIPSNGGSTRKNIDVKTKPVVNKSSFFHRSRVYFKLSLKEKLKPVPSTLGEAALALHYANVIVLIEKIVSSPRANMIDVQTRDNLYNRLPTTIRTALRSKLKWYAKGKLETEWNVVLTQILEWLAPLAHNMTLYFANQAKTEAAMVELLVGLHYVCRIDKKQNRRTEEVPTYALCTTSLHLEGQTLVAPTIKFGSM